MKLTLCRFCEYADEMTGGRRLLAGILDTLRPQGYPCANPPFCIALEFECEPADVGTPLGFKLVLHDEAGHQYLQTTTEGPKPVEESDIGERTFLAVPIPPNRIVFPAPGRYELDVLKDGARLGGDRLLLT